MDKAILFGFGATIGFVLALLMLWLMFCAMRLMFCAVQMLLRPSHKTSAHPVPSEPAASWTSKRTHRVKNYDFTYLAILLVGTITVMVVAMVTY